MWAGKPTVRPLVQGLITARVSQSVERTTMSGSRVGGTHGKHSIQKKKHDAARATETSARACPLMKLCRGFFVDRVELELGGDHGLQQSRVGSCCDLERLLHV